jgi:simple sugar transport system ATP-binding protein
MKIELQEIDKSFGPVHANEGICLTILPGTIMGILGENGAGKSTLMKILSGSIHADGGRILLDGRDASIQTPSDAIRDGIGMLHQDPLDFPPMRVIDSFLSGHPSGLFPRKSAAVQALLDLEERFDFSIEPEAYVEALTVGERQQLEILRLLWLGVNALILDEPTTGISALQKEKLFTALRRLAQEGNTVIFVSHKLEEVEELCDHVAVLRSGQLVGEAEPPFHTDQLVEMMFGKMISLGGRRAAEVGAPALELSGVSVEDHRLRVSDVNLQVRSGEVIGLAGMEGSGQRLFLWACAGLTRPVSGRIRFRGRDLTGKGYRAFLRQGIAYLPGSRLEEGLISGLTLTEHFTLAQERRGLLIDRRACHGLAEGRISDFNIHGQPESTVESLSGGNQQRALLALLKSPLSLLLMEHPTRGLDIESVVWIWGKLRERRLQGTAIIFISSDLEEILLYSDRILVFFGGRVSQPLGASATTVDHLGQLIGGAGWDTFDQERVP